MADENEAHIEAVPENDEDSTDYKPPPEKSLNEILQQDKDDDALEKYKEKLLGSATKGTIIVDENSEKKVLVRKLAMVVEGMPDKEIDLSNDVEKLKDSNFTIKEGIGYKIRIDFHVQREIVTGLKYIQKTCRKGICVDKMSHMVGSYAPKKELQYYLTPMEDAPSGIISRGHYSVKSLFTDDDGHEHLKWEWSFDIKKDWD